MTTSTFISDQKMEMLFQFFGGYFHQDWTMEATTADEIVGRFIKDGFTRQELGNLANGIEAYANSKESDAAAEQGLYAELGCYYMPSADGIGARAWLHHVANLLQKAQ